MQVIYTIISQQAKLVKDIKFRLLSKIEYNKYKAMIPPTPDFWWWLEDTSQYTYAFVDEDGFIENTITNDFDIGFRIIAEFTLSGFKNVEHFKIDNENFTCLSNIDNKIIAISDNLIFNKVIYTDAFLLLDQINKNQSFLVDECLLKSLNICKPFIELDDSPIELPEGVISNLPEIMLEHDMRALRYL